MKKYLLLIFCWYAQDLAQILMTQTFLAPEIFAIGLMWCATQQEESDGCLRLLLAALAGGLLWDLRFVGVPGYTAALYTLAQFCARALWFEIPRQGRRTLTFLAIAGCICATLTPLRLAFWDERVLLSRVALVFAAQWTLTAIVLLVFALLPAFSYEDESF